MAKKSPGRCFANALFWFFVNAAFALVPLLCLILVRPCQKDDIATVFIHQLIDDGIIMFACCALMGAVWVDIFLSELEFKKAQNLAVTVTPLALVVVICFTYFQIIQGHIDHSVFASMSMLYKFVVPLTVFYCILGKYLLLRSEK